MANATKSMGIVFILIILIIIAIVFLFKRNKSNGKSNKNLIISVFVIIVGIIVAMIVSEKISSNNIENAREHARNELLTTNNQISSEIQAIIKEFASQTNYNAGSATKYAGCSKYRVSKDGTQIYKIKYNTSLDSMYYYQLISLDENNSKINKSSGLFQFFNNGSGQTLELENSFEKIWGK